MLKLDFKGRIDSDIRTATRDIGLQQSQFDVQSRRVGLEGTLFKRIDFEVSRELGANSRPWRDAYVTASSARPGVASVTPRSITNSTRCARAGSLRASASASVQLPGSKIPLV